MRQRCKAKLFSDKQHTDFVCNTWVYRTTPGDWPPLIMFENKVYSKFHLEYGDGKGNVVLYYTAMPVQIIPQDMYKTTPSIWPEL